MRSAAATVALGLTLCSAVHGADGGDTIHRNAQWQMRVAVPAGWKAVEDTSGLGLRVVLHRPSPQLAKETCIFDVLRVPGTASQTQADLDRIVRRRAMHSKQTPLSLPEPEPLSRKIIDRGGHATEIAEETFTIPDSGTFIRTVAYFELPGLSYEGFCVARATHYPKWKALYARLLGSFEAER